MTAEVKDLQKTLNWKQEFSLKRETLFLQKKKDFPWNSAQNFRRARFVRSLPPTSLLISLATRTRSHEQQCEYIDEKTIQFGWNNLQTVGGENNILSRSPEKEWPSWESRLEEGKQVRLWKFFFIPDEIFKQRYVQLVPGSIRHQILNRFRSTGRCRTSVRTLLRLSRYLLDVSL